MQVERLRGHGSEQARRGSVLEDLREEHGLNVKVVMYALGELLR